MLWAKWVQCSTVFNSVLPCEMRLLTSPTGWVEITPMRYAPLACSGGLAFLPCGRCVWTSLTGWVVGRCFVPSIGREGELRMVGW